MSKTATIKKIASKNPKVDVAQVQAALTALERLRADGVVETGYCLVDPFVRTSSSSRESLHKPDC